MDQSFDIFCINIAVQYSGSFNPKTSNMPASVFIPDDFFLDMIH